MTKKRNYQTFAEQRDLKTDRLIEIYVGDVKEDEKPFLIPQSVLNGISKYFIRALDPNAFREGQNARLELPEADYDAWRVFLFWAVNHEMPELWIRDEEQKGEEMPDLTGEEEAALLTNCWIVGDKYGVPDFQDAAMLLLMENFTWAQFNPEGIKMAFEALGTDSALSRIWIEEMVIMHRDHSMDDDDLDGLDGIGVLQEFIRTRNKWKYKARDRFDVVEEHGHGIALWRTYMVGDGPWMHPRINDGEVVTA